MAGQNQYPPAAPFDGTEDIAVWQHGETRTATTAQIVALVPQIASDVAAFLLLGLTTGTSAVITAADTIVGAFGKLQAQIFSETARARAAEVAVAGQVSAEATRAISAEGALAPKLSPVFTGTPTGNFSAALVTSSGSTTARALAARDADVFNVKDWGAVGNGSTDDSAALQACINAAVAAHGAVFIPPSTGGYLINTPLNVTNATTLKIYGVGGTNASSFDLSRSPPVSGSTLIGNTGTGKAVMELIGSNSITLRDFTITTASAATTVSTIGILFGTGNLVTFYTGTPGGAGIVMDNVHVLLKDPGGATNTGQAIPLYGNNANTCTITGCSTTGNYGLVLCSNNPLSITPTYQGWGSTIQSDGNYVAGCAFLGFGPGQPLYLEGCNDSSFQQIYVNLLNSSTTYAGNPWAIYMKDCNDLHIKVEQDYFPSLAKAEGTLTDLHLFGVHFPSTTPMQSTVPLMVYFNGTSVAHCEFKARCVGGTSGASAGTTYHYSCVGNTTPTMNYFRNCEFEFDLTQVPDLFFGNVVNNAGIPYLNLRFNGDEDTTNFAFMWSSSGATSATPANGIRAWFNGKAQGTG